MLTHGEYALLPGSGLPPAAAALIAADPDLDTLLDPEPEPP
jgi:hypothetical protein